MTGVKSSCSSLGPRKEKKSDTKCICLRSKAKLSVQIPHVSQQLGILKPPLNLEISPNLFAVWHECFR